MLRKQADPKIYGLTGNLLSDQALTTLVMAERRMNMKTSALLNAMFRSVPPMQPSSLLKKYSSADKLLRISTMTNDRKERLLGKLAKDIDVTKKMSEEKARKLMKPIKPLGPADPHWRETRLVKRLTRPMLKRWGGSKDYVKRTTEDKDFVASQVALQRKFKAQARGEGGYHDPQFQESTPIDETMDMRHTANEGARRGMLARLKKRDREQPSHVPRFKNDIRDRYRDVVSPRHRDAVASELKKRHSAYGNVRP